MDRDTASRIYSPTCHCEGVAFGSYQNTVIMKAPSGNLVTIDTCIATEIGFLWHQGVETINSCCGHKKLEPSVVVSEVSVNKMRELGYSTVPFDCALPKATFSLARG